MRIKDNATRMRTPKHNLFDQSYLLKTSRNCLFLLSTLSCRFSRSDSYRALGSRGRGLFFEGEHLLGHETGPAMDRPDIEGQIKEGIPSPKRGVTRLDSIDLSPFERGGINIFFIHDLHVTLTKIN